MYCVLGVMPLYLGPICLVWLVKSRIVDSREFKCLLPMCGSWRMSGRYMERAGFYDYVYAKNGICVRFHSIL